MTISLKTAKLEEVAEIHQLQNTSFQELFEKYQDPSTNPATESLASISQKMEQSTTTYYFIENQGIKIGGLRLVLLASQTARIGPIFITPENCNRGYAQQAMLLLEQEYPSVTLWQLDTIKQEEKLIRFYQKLGYRLTGDEYLIKEGMSIVELYKHTK